MALVFPRPLPCGIVTVEFELSRGMAMNRLAGGSIQVRETAEPRWRCALTWAPMQRAEYQALRAWVDTMRGGLRTFLAHDALQPYPVLYPKAKLLALTRPGGDAFDGTATVASLSASAIGLTNLPVGFALKAGDYLGLVQSGRYGLHRLVEDATAAGPSGTLTASVEPRVATNLFTTAAVATVVRPSCTMVLDASPFSPSRSAASRAPVSLSGIQDLR